MNDTTHLADTSALTRANRPAVAERLGPLIRQGALASCSMVSLELLFSARGPADHRLLRAEIEATYPLVPITEATFDRAIEAQSLLAARSAHRGAALPDLIIAAAAESAGITVLHYDADFDLIASVTAQPTEWVVTAGSID